MIKVKKNGQKAWVTFTVIKKDGLNSVEISGSWNNWKREKMKQKKSGDFYITKILPIGKIYEFRYIINENDWENEEDAISVPNKFGSYNSAIDLA